MPTSRSDCQLALVLTALGVCAAAAVGTPADTPRRFGLTKGDEFRFCAAGVFGRPVLVGVDIVVPCPDTRQNLLKALELKDVAVLLTDEWVYMYPGAYARSAAHPRPFPSGLWQWKELKIRTSIERMKISPPRVG